MPCVYLVSNYLPVAVVLRLSAGRLVGTESFVSVDKRLCVFFCGCKAVNVEEELSQERQEGTWQRVKAGLASAYIQARSL